MTKQLITASTILVVGLAMGFGILLSGPKLESRVARSVAPLVRVVEVTPKRIQLTTVTHGTVAPRTESALVPEVSGRVVAMSEAMVTGGFFKQGDVLIDIETADYEVSLEQARAGLIRAESDLTNARKGHERQLTLARKQSVSVSQQDDAINRLRIAEAAQREAAARLLKAKKDLARTRLIAPFDGRVRSERVDVGQFINRGIAVAVLYATDYAEVRLPILDDALAFLDLGLLRSDSNPSDSLKVLLRAKLAGQDQEWQGYIVRTEGELDPRTRMINLVARVDAPYAQAGDSLPLAVGLFVEAEIYGPYVDDVIVLPRSALRNKNQVMVVDKDKRLRFRSIGVLRIADDLVYVDQGLVMGELVSISGLSSALDGILVRPLHATAVPSAGE